MTRQRIVATLAGLSLAAILSNGCFLQTVKLVSIDLGNVSAVNGATLYSRYVDLEAENSTYRDNKDKFSNVEDVAVLGTFKNNLGTGVNAEVWIVRNPSTPLTTEASVRSAGTLVWSLTLGPNESKSLHWDNAADLFNDAGKDAVKDELEGDAVFTLYVIGSTGTYDVTATNASVAVVIGIDPFGAP
ncbi:MAG TPA: hypothetical protein VGK93_01545 [Candidatus Eisenbacteria bacterium]|jgi:hypothetical protein